MLQFKRRKVVEDIMDSNIYFFYLYNKISIIFMKLKGGYTNNIISISDLLKQYEDNKKPEIISQIKPNINQKPSIPMQKMHVNQSIKKETKYRTNKYLYIVKTYYQNYIDLIQDDIKFKKNRPNNYKSYINYINDYKYYKKNLDIDKSPKVISYSKYKINNIKSRIYDYFNVDNFFTNNIDLFINKDDMKSRKSSSLSSSSLLSSSSSLSLSSSKKYKFGNSSIIKNIRRRFKKGGTLKQTGIDLLSVLNILDSKHDFYDDIDKESQDYLKSKYISKINRISPIYRNKIEDLFGNMSNTTKDKNFEEDILQFIIKAIITDNELIEDINDSGNFEFIDISDDSSKYIYYPELDNSKVELTNDTDDDTIITLIREYFGYNTIINDYRYMFDTKIALHDKLSEVLKSKNKTVFSKIANIIKPFENGYDPHPSNDIIIETQEEYDTFVNIVNKNFNTPITSSLTDEYNYSTINAVRKYINFSLTYHNNQSIPNKYLPIIILKNFDKMKFPKVFRDKYINMALTDNVIKYSNDCSFYETYTIHGFNNIQLTPLNNIIIYTKSFNERLKLKDYINTLTSYINSNDAAIDAYMLTVIDELTSHSKSVDADFVIRFIIIHCFYNRENIISKTESVKEIIDILYDLKKSGDWGQSLFCSKYNSIKESNECFFTSGDKLSAARSIMAGNVKTITASDYDKLFDISGNSTKRSILTLYRNGNIMTFKYFIKYLQINILSFIAFKHINLQMSYLYFVKNDGTPTVITEDTLITNSNFNFEFFKYFILVIFYHLRIFYNTYTIFNINNSEFIPFNIDRYKNNIYQSLKKLIIDKNALGITTPTIIEIQNTIGKYPGFNDAEEPNKDIITSYIHSNIFDNINLLLNRKAINDIEIIHLYLEAIDVYYSTDRQPNDISAFTELDQTLMVDMMKLVDTMLNNIKKLNIPNYDTKETSNIISEFEAIYSGPKLLYQKFLFLIQGNFIEDFYNCKKFINTITSYNEICAVLLVDSDYTNDNFISNIKTKNIILPISSDSRKLKKITYETNQQKTEVKKIIDISYNKILEFINIIGKHFNSLGKFNIYGYDILSDIHDINVKEYNYVEECVDKYLSDISAAITYEQRNNILISYYSYNTITRLKGIKYDEMLESINTKILDVWATFPELNLKKKFTDNNITDDEEKYYKDYLKLIKSTLQPTANAKATATATAKAKATAKSIKKTAANINKKPATKIQTKKQQPLASAPPAPVAPVAPSPPVAPAPVAPVVSSHQGSLSKNKASLDTNISNKKQKISAPPPASSPPAAPPAAPALAASAGPRRSTRPHKPSTKLSGGVAKKKAPKNDDDKKINKLTHRLYIYFVSVIIPHYNYKLCVNPVNPVTSPLNKDLLTSFSNILTDCKFRNIACVASRSTYFNEIMLYRAAYLNKIIKDETNNINNYIDRININIQKTFESLNDITSLKTELIIIIDSFKLMTEILKYLEIATENIKKTNTSLINITNAKPSVVNNELNNNAILINQRINGILPFITNIKNSRYTEDLELLKDAVIEFRTLYSRYILNNPYKNYFDTYEQDVINLNTLNTQEQILNIIRIITEKINKPYEDNDINNSIIQKLYYTVFLSDLYLHDIKYNIKQGKLNINNQIQYYKELIINNRETIIQKLITDNPKNDSLVEQIINFIEYIININYYLICCYDKYIYISKNIYSINQIIPNITNIIQRIDTIIYNTDVFYEENNILDPMKYNPLKKLKDNHPELNKFITLYTKKDKIYNSITTVYKDHEQLQQLKKTKELNFKLEETSNFPADFTKFSLLSNIDNISKSQPQKISSRLKRQPVELQNIEEDEEDEPGDNNVKILKENINKLYNAIKRKLAATTTKNPKELPIKDMKPIFDTFFTNISILGTEIKLSENGERVKNAIEGAKYNPEIYIQDIVFLTIIAKHFNDIIKMKNDKIYNILNKIEGENTYKIHKFMKKPNNYYNNDDYKIITIIYTCIYNIIQVKYISIFNIKEKNLQDKYKIMGYFDTSNTYNKMEKLFGMFDLVMAITKF